MMRLVRSVVAQRVLLSAFFYTSFALAETAANEVKVHHYLLSKNATIYVAYEVYSGPFNALHIFDQDKGMVTLRSITPETNTINNERDQTNPLFNSHIDLLKLVESRPAVTLKEKPAHFYLFDLVTTDSYQHILAVENLCDAQGEITAGIENFCFASSGLVEPLDQYIIAAVKGADGSHFGTGASGLALIKGETIPVENGRPKKILKLRDAVTGALGARAVPCTLNELCKTTDKATVLPVPPALCWDSALERLYIGLHIRLPENALPNDCCAALSMAAINAEGGLRIDPIMGIADPTLPYMAHGPAGEAHVHHVAQFTLKNRLTYLIMVGGAGTAAETSKKVYALPLTNHGYGNARAQVMENKVHGTIAASSHQSHERIQDMIHYKLLRTQALEQAIDASNPPHLSTTAMTVGAGDAPGTISQVLAVENCVYISTMDGTANEPAGIFYSQALYKGDGTIFAWTPWRRFAAIQSPVSQFTIDPNYGFCRYISHQEGAIANFTSWRTPDHSAESFGYGALMAHINQDFATHTVHAADLLYESHYYLLLAGEGKIALYSTATSEPLYIYENERLLEIGSITSVASSETPTGFTVLLGGKQGVALLDIRREENGWSTTCTILPHKYAIEKIQALQNSFIILTHEGIYTLNVHLPADARAELHKILDSKECEAFLYDLVVGQEGGLLATARDLYSFTFSSDGAIEQLTPCCLPLHARETVRGLMTATPDGSTVSFSEGMQVYALISNAVENYSHVYRLYVQRDETGHIRTEIASNFKRKNDAFYPYVIFPRLQQKFVTDGSQLFAITPAMQQTKPRLYVMQANAEDIMIMSKYTMHAVRLKLGKTAGIRDMFWSKALNTWLVAGDFGIRLLQ